MRPFLLNPGAMDQRSQALQALVAVEEMVRAEYRRIEELRYRSERKPDDSLVTEADIWLEKRIHGILLEHFPQLTLVGEESFEGLQSFDGVIALVDPIDGTENFCSGLPEWGCCVGIWNDGRHLASLLLMPELGKRLISGEAVKAFQGSRLVGYASVPEEGFPAELDEAMQHRVTGCAVYSFYQVITGAFKNFLNPRPAYVWDLLPGAALARENGCQVQLNGQPYQGELLDPARKHRAQVYR